MSDYWKSFKLDTYPYTRISITMRKLLTKAIKLITKEKKKE